MQSEPLPLELAENREMSCIATSALKQHKQKRDILMILVLLSPSEHCIHVQCVSVSYHYSTYAHVLSAGVEARYSTTILAPTKALVTKSTLLASLLIVLFTQPLVSLLR